jgi:hypothetical protein
MSFNRLFYDKSTERQHTQDSMSVGNYSLQTPKQYTQYPEDGILAQRSGYRPNIGIENSLFGMNQDATKYPETPDEIRDQSQYNDERSLFFLPEHRGFNVEYTRLSNPTMTLKSIGINRFDPICIDPQANIFFAGPSPMATQMLAKDNYKKCAKRRQINVNSMHPDPKMQ